MNHPNSGLSERIRSTAERTFVRPARQAGKRKFSIAVREIMRELGSEGKATQSLCCSALRAKAFLDGNGLLLDGQEGPPSGRGASTVYHYALRGTPEHKVEQKAPLSHEEAAALAERYLAPLRGLLANEISDFGGSDALIRWIRHDEPPA